MRAIAGGQGETGGSLEGAALVGCKVTAKAEAEVFAAVCALQPGIGPGDLQKLRLFSGAVASQGFIPPVARRGVALGKGKDEDHTSSFSCYRITCISVRGLCHSLCLDCLFQGLYLSSVLADS